MDLNRHLPHVRADRFSMIPRADVPRSTFVTTTTKKLTFDAGNLVPWYVDEVLPGDVHQGQISIFARLSTLLFPLMDNVCLETFFFFVPNRLVWTNWRKLMGEQDSPGDSISYTVPTLTSAAGGFPVGSIMDYMGIPVAGQIGAGNTLTVNALPLRAYKLIYHEWFRDQNLQGVQFARGTDDGNGPDNLANYQLYKRNKAHDYFTSALPWPLKGGNNVSYLTGLANVTGIAISNVAAPNVGTPTANDTPGAAAGWAGYYGATSTTFFARAAGTGTGANPLIQADLSSTAGATINALRTAFQTQRLLERDARGGTRYTEILRSHFGVISPDARLQRPEYIGGGKTYVNTSAIPQTSGTGASGTTSPLGALGATAVASDQHSFSYHSTEHGYILGIVHVTADLTYQQGLNKLWSRSTRYDFYWPVFAFLGEQAVLNKEIYCDGSANDATVFGYQERWAEYKHMPSTLAGLFRSTSAGTIDPWHAAIKFTSVPALNSTFIQDAPPLSRVLAAGAAANGMQILMDSAIKLKRTRPMPMFSVPGNLDRF